MASTTTTSKSSNSNTVSSAPPPSSPSQSRPITVTGNSTIVPNATSAAAAAAAGTSLDNNNNNNTTTNTGPPIWEMNSTQIVMWIRGLPALRQDMALVTKLLPNLITSITAILPKPNHHNPSSSDQPQPPPSKRFKMEQQQHDHDDTTTTTTNNNKNGNNTTQQQSTTTYDPYNIWIGHQQEQNDDNDQQQEQEQIPETFGAVLVELTKQGLVSALTLNHSKSTITIHNNTNKPNQQPQQEENADIQTTINKIAMALHRAIEAKMEGDFLTHTPDRIRQMLCSDIDPMEFKSIRRRVYDTVILGKGLNTNNTTNNNKLAGEEDHDEDEEEDLPVASRPTVHDIEKFKKCKACGNNDQSAFVLDRRNGDVICSNCGTIIMESIMHEGSAYRKFEGEADRNHHGDAQNPLFSNAHNLATTLGGMQVLSSVNHGFGTQSNKGLENILRNAHAYTELNISQFGTKQGERKTRIGYKDRQKRNAFGQMTHVGDALNLHEAVVQRAKELFAGFRDDRELVQQFKGVIAACLCEAFDQLSRDGHRILKLREQDAELVGEHSVRANRRNDLHHASMAGKGGLQLDMSHLSEKDDKTQTGTMMTSAKPAFAIEQKPAPTWDLDDCRSWLLEASRNIAQEWIKARSEGATNIPEGSQEELEGKLVEHTITLCDNLEAELKASRVDQKVVGGKKVVTPRVQDMAQLSIKWQHSHERGSGGKGGVGNSGHATLPGRKPRGRSGRRAGQILILKTAKKLGTTLNDPVAGEAFHKELRFLAGRQEARKRKDIADEAVRQRFQQMKRKPWLQARAEH